MVMLTAADEEALAAVAVKLKWRGIDAAWFYEPDLGGELTAIAVTDPRAWRRLAGLPLLLREEVISDARGEHVLAAGEGCRAEGSA